MKAERHPSAHEMCSAQPLCTAAERRFVEAMNAAADDGVGFGWMQQVAEWEWLHRHGPGAWGPPEAEVASHEDHARRLARCAGLGEKS